MSINLTHSKCHFLFVVVVAFENKDTIPSQYSVIPQNKWNLKLNFQLFNKYSVTLNVTGNLVLEVHDIATVHCSVQTEN